MGTSGILFATKSIFGLIGTTNSNFLNPQNFDIFVNKTEDNLLVLKTFFKTNKFKLIDLNSPEINTFISGFDLPQQKSIILFLQNWNSLIINNSEITLKNIDIIFNEIFSQKNLTDPNLLNDPKFINALSIFSELSNKIGQLNIYYSDFSPFMQDYPKVISNFNNLFGQIGDTSFFEPITKITSVEVDKIEILIINLPLYLQSQNNILGNEFADQIVNIIYKLALDKNNLIFVPGWTKNIFIDGTQIMSMIPYQISTIALNVTCYLPYNIRLLSIGIIANSLILPGLTTFAFIIIKRTCYILFWPFFMMYKMSKGAVDDGEGMKQATKEIFYKFFQIVFLAFFWNLATLIVIEMFNAFQKSDFFNSNYIWVKDIASILILTGVLIASGMLIKEFIAQIEQEKNIFDNGASKITQLSQKGAAKTNTLSNSFKFKSGFKKTSFLNKSGKSSLSGSAIAKNIK